MPAARPSSSLPLPPALAVIILALVAATLAAYWGVGACSFVNLDDDAYVEFQPMVNQGLRSAAVVWAFTASHSTNWHPLTSLSHMLDCDLFGVTAGPMHWENLAWHTLNTVLVFLVWRALSGALWRSAFVAALFALHPLHVESVAWIAERKDLLSTFFWLLGLGAYLHWTRRPTLPRYTLVALALALALLSKPMAVTFPCTLLLLDFWPLQRWPGKKWTALVWEKLPLFALVAVHSVITFTVQHSTGSADYGKRFGLAERVGNALVAYVRYLGKTLWPESLAAFYPHPGMWPAWLIGGTLAVLAAISWLAWRQRRTAPWFAFGWLWFLGTLVPVIGLAQVGAQSMADRYTYVPLLGVFTVFAWGLGEAVSRFPSFRLPIVGAALMALLACEMLTRQQVPAWQDSLSLQRHSLAVGEDNATARYLLAVSLQAAGRPESEVLAEFQRSVALQPDYVNAITQVAMIALRHQQFAEARGLIEQTLRLEPANPSLQSNLASLDLWQGRTADAIARLSETVRQQPNFTGGHHALAQIYLKQNRLDDARHELEATLQSAKWDFPVWYELAQVQAVQGHPSEAKQSAERALWINPAFAPARKIVLILDRAERLK